MQISNFILTSGKVSQSTKSDIISNNVANQGSTGNQKQFLINTEVNDGQGNIYISDSRTVNSFLQGNVKYTGRSLDFALSKPKHFFMIMTPLGNRFTRAGSFKLDTNGILVDTTGYPVLNSAGGLIDIDPSIVNEVVTNNEGNIFDKNGNIIGNIGIFEFASPESLQKMGNNLLKTEEEPINTENAILVQRSLEESNINPIVETTDMINTSRNVSSLQDLTNKIYKLQTSLISTISESQ